MASQYLSPKLWWHKSVTIFCSRNFAGHLVALLLLLGLLFSLRLEWVFLPLSDGLRGAELRVTPLGLPIFFCLLVFYLIAGVLLKLGRRWVQWLMLVPFLLVFTWPFVGGLEQSDYLANYFIESRERTVIDELFRLQVQENVNIQPKYKPMFDTSNRWQQLMGMFQTLGVGWYLFCVLSLVLPIFLMRLYTGRGLYWSSYLATLIVCCLSAGWFFSKDPYQFPQTPSYAGTVALCNERLRATPGLAASDFFVTRCAEAYNSLRNWQGPVAALPVVASQMGDRQFIRVPEDKYENLKHLLIPMVEIKGDQPVENAFREFAKRQLRLLMAMQAIRYLEDEHYAQASSSIHALSEHKGVSAFVILGYSAAQLGQPEVAIAQFDQALANLGNTTVEANLYCSLGDAMIASDQLARAREFFHACRDLDGELNYWAINALGGS